MRENPRILCYPPSCNWRVKMHEVRTIRRKDRVGNDSESSETTRQSPAKAGEDIVRTAWRHAEDDRNVHPASCKGSREVVTASSEIPCRVSSDLHEWWNDRATVLASGSANLWFRWRRRRPASRRKDRVHLYCTLVMCNGIGCVPYPRSRENPTSTGKEATVKFAPDCQDPL